MTNQVGGGLHSSKTQSILIYKQKIFCALLANQATKKHIKQSLSLSEDLSDLEETLLEPFFTSSLPTTEIAALHKRVFSSVSTCKQKCYFDIPTYGCYARKCT